MRLCLALIALSGFGCDRVLGIENPEAARVDAGVDSNPGVHLVSVELSPDPLNLPVGQMKQLKAIASFSDNTKKDVTSQSTFQLDSGSSATITPGGLVTGVSQGASRVSASFQAMSGHIDVVIGPIVPDHIVLATGDYTTAQNQEAFIRAKLVFSDNSSNDITFDSGTTFTSDNTAVATTDTFSDVISVGPGAATITVSNQGVSASFVVTVTATQCHPVINEVQSGSAASDSDEWVEIFNPCTGSIDVTNWTLDYRSANNTGATDTNLLATLPAGTMPAGTMFLLCSDAATELFCDVTWTGGFMAQQNGAVGLRSGPKDTGALVDAMAYGTVQPGHPFIEGTAALPLVNGKVLARLPVDGIDQNNNVGDFVLTAASTPGGLNEP